MMSWIGRACEWMGLQKYEMHQRVVEIKVTQERLYEASKDHRVLDDDEWKIQRIRKYKNIKRGSLHFGTDKVEATYTNNSEPASLKMWSTLILGAFWKQRSM